MNRRGARSGFRASVALVWPLAAELRALGFDADALCAGVGLTVDRLADPDTRIPFEDLIALGEAAMQITGDPAFGLHLAEHYRPSVFGVLDYLARSSLTMGDAIRNLCRYNRLLQDVSEASLTLEGARAVISERTLGGAQLPPPMIENSLANLVVVGRELTEYPLEPVEVSFTHQEPAYSAEHARIFRSTVRFGADRNAIVLRLADLDLPIPQADPGLRVILQRHAEQLLERVPRAARFSDRVRELAAAELKDGTPTAQSIARKLEMSERTLRRRLEKDGTSYEALLDGFRRELAELYLAEPTLSIPDVAIMLGYSEESPFRRAFRRWHGISPAGYRKRNK
jgi:AraC-like DNA-binding protein